MLLPSYIYVEEGADLHKTVKQFRELMLNLLPKLHRLSLSQSPHPLLPSYSKPDSLTDANTPVTNN